MSEEVKFMFLVKDMTFMIQEYSKRCTCRMHVEMTWDQDIEEKINKIQELMINTDNPQYHGTVNRDKNGYLTGRFTINTAGVKNE